MIYILSGAIESGKTNALVHWAKGRNNIFGIVSPNNDSHTRILLDVATKETYAMQTKTATSETITVGRYTFYKSAFTKGNNIIKSAAEKQALGYIIIDELGKLELCDLGFYKGASHVIAQTENHKDLHSILVIRDYLLDQIIAHFGIKNYVVLHKLSELNQKQIYVT